MSATTTAPVVTPFLVLVASMVAALRDGTLPDDLDTTAQPREVQEAYREALRRWRMIERALRA